MGESNSLKAKRHEDIERASAREGGDERCTNKYVVGA
jgi:hypothetical protein